MRHDHDTSACHLFVPASPLVLRRPAGCRLLQRPRRRAPRRQPRRRAAGHSRRRGRKPVDRSVPARHRLARRRRAGGSQRRNRRPRDRDAGRARHARRRRARCSSASPPPETAAQLREAEANAAQIEARLGLVAGQPFDPMRVPDVMNAKASLDWAEAEFNRIKSLLEQKVVSQSEFDQRRTQVEAARQQYQAAQNWRAAVVPLARRRRAPASRSRARPSADTVVRAPFAGLVAERLVSVGDYVTRGTQRRHGRADRSAARRADGARAVRLARQGRASRCG